MLDSLPKFGRASVVEAGSCAAMPVVLDSRENSAGRTRVLAFVPSWFTGGAV
ncbi:MAG TPA: hypothetical protein VFI45_13710 [Candidatus Acidoferrum sp.]|nr:hypothetical protein [Candidatus Acidoferrum sp.]